MPAEKMNLAGRDDEILRILDLISKATIDFIVVGGYAVSAYGKHRFSVDCDLVIRSTEVEKIRVLLESEGYTQEETNDQFDQTYGGGFIRYAKKIGILPVSVDLLTDSLVCRQTDGSWSFDYVLSNSLIGKVTGIQDSVNARIPSRELLMAFKIHSGRKADVRDVVMLGDEADWRRVFTHLNRGSPVKLESALEEFSTTLDDKKLTDSLKGEFRLQGDVTPMIRRAKEWIGKLLKEMKDH